MKEAHHPAACRKMSKSWDMLRRYMPRWSLFRCGWCEFLHVLVGLEVVTDSDGPASEIFICVSSYLVILLRMKRCFYHVRWRDAVLSGRCNCWWDHFLWCLSMSIETVIVACRSFECKWPCSASGSLSSEAFACSEILVQHAQMPNHWVSLTRCSSRMSHLLSAAPTIVVSLRNLTAAQKSGPYRHLFSPDLVPDNFWVDLKPLMRPFGEAFLWSDFKRPNSQCIKAWPGDF